MKILFTMAVLAVLGASAQAADFSDPTWPCIQRKVTALSVGQMWSGPLPEEGAKADATAQRIGSAIAARRTPIAQAEKMIDDYAAALGEGRDMKLALLFKAAFERINAERGDIIGGIGRYAGRQTDLAEKVDALQQTVTALAGKEDKTDDEWDKLEELEDQLIWDTRIYKERAQSLTYVCESPVLLEKRAFALARALMTHLE